MRLADMRATIRIEQMKKTGEWQELLEEGQRLLALRGETDFASNLLLLGFSDAKEPLTKREVKNAYRRQARKLHPDKGGDAEAFKALYAAYRKLLATAKN